MDSNTSVNI